MRKIKEYINKHLKLKKTLKILAVIGVIFSVGFNILIIGVGSCSIHSQKNDSSSIKEPLATTPVYSALDYNNSSGNTLFLYSPSDIASTNTFLGIVEFAKQYDENFDPFNTAFTTPWTQTLTVPSYYSIQWSQLRSKISDNTLYSTAFNELFSDNLKQQYIYIRFTYFSTYKYWECRLALSFNAGNTEHSVLWTYTLGTLNIPNCSTTNLNQGSVILDRTESGLYYILNYDSRKGTFYDEGYTNGYNSGYTQGFNDGNTTTSTPFTLIRSAFSSISSILNIQVLPNLTLGVLIFAPLVIIIIIAIFKIFRG